MSVRMGFPLRATASLVILTQLVSATALGRETLFWRGIPRETARALDPEQELVRRDPAQLPADAKVRQDLRKPLKRVYEIGPKPISSFFPWLKEPAPGPDTLEPPTPPAEINAFRGELLEVADAMEKIDSHKAFEKKILVEFLDRNPTVLSRRALRDRVRTLQMGGQEPTLDEILGTLWIDILAEKSMRGENIDKYLQAAQELADRKDEQASFFSSTMTYTMASIMGVGSFLWGVMWGAFIAGPIGGIAGALADPLVKSFRERAGQMSAKGANKIGISIFLGNWFDPQQIENRFYNRSARWISAHNRAFRWMASKIGWRNAIITQSEEAKAKLEEIKTELRSDESSNWTRDKIKEHMPRFLEMGVQMWALWDQGLPELARARRRIEIDIHKKVPLENANGIGLRDMEHTVAKNLALSRRQSIVDTFPERERPSVLAQADELIETYLNRTEKMLLRDNNSLDAADEAKIERLREAFFERARTSGGDYHARLVKDYVADLLTLLEKQVHAENAAAYSWFYREYERVRHELEHWNATTAKQKVDFGTWKWADNVLGLHNYGRKYQHVLIRMIEDTQKQIDHSRDQVLEELELAPASQGLDPDPTPESMQTKWFGSRWMAAFWVKVGSLYRRDYDRVHSKTPRGLSCVARALSL